MNLRGLVIAAILLAGLSGFLYWSQTHKPSDEGAATNSPAAPSIMKVNPSDVTRLTIRIKPAEPVVVEKIASDKWQVTQPATYPANTQTVYAVLSTLSGLNAERVIEEKSSDLKKYGLDQPGLEVIVTGKDHSVQSLLLGDETPAGGNTYATVTGTGKVFALATYNKSSLSKTADDFRVKK